MKPTTAATEKPFPNRRFNCCRKVSSANIEGVATNQKDRQMRRLLFALVILPISASVTADYGSWPFTADEITRFEQPRAMAFLPDGYL